MSTSDQDMVLVALGANLGNAAATIRSAVAELHGLAGARFRQSSLWQTSPVDCPPGSPLFINAAVSFVPQPSHTPETLLTALLELEKQFGRVPKTVLNEARPLDLDLIAFGSEVRATPSLTLPHPRAHQRGFVLQPLAEIVPGFVLPGQSQTIAELLRQLCTEELLERVDDTPRA